MYNFNSYRKFFWRALKSVENASNHIWRMIEWVLQCVNLNRERKHSYILPAVHFNILLLHLLYHFRLIFGALMRMNYRKKVQCNFEIECLTMVYAQCEVSTKTSDLIFIRNSRVKLKHWRHGTNTMLEFNKIQGCDWLRRNLNGSLSQSINHKQLLNLLLTEQYLEWR